MNVSGFPRMMLALAVFMPLLACSAATVPGQAGVGDAGSGGIAGCAARGGTVAPRGLGGKPTCVVRFADAGKSCSGKADCRGLCIVSKGYVEVGAAAAGQCQAENTPFGCYAKVEGGRISTPSLCTE